MVGEHNRRIRMKKCLASTKKTKAQKPAGTTKNKKKNVPNQSATNSNDENEPQQSGQQNM